MGLFSRWRPSGSASGTDPRSQPRAKGAAGHYEGDQRLVAVRRQLDLDPDDPVNHLMMGNALMSAGQLELAGESFRAALALRPVFPEANFNLGVALHQRGEFEAASQCYLRVLDVAPTYANAHLNLGTVYKDLGRLDDALASCEKAAALAPDLAAAHGNLGNLQWRLGRTDEAVASYRRSLKLDDSVADVHFNLGNALTMLRRQDEAAECLQRAIRLQPDFYEPHISLGSLFRDCGRLEESLALHQRALELRPDSAEAHNNLGNTLKSLGRFAEAVESYRRAIAIDPQMWVAHSNVLLAMNYAGVSSAAERFGAAQEFGRAVAAVAPAAVWSEDGAGQPERLRVGLVSGDLRNHPVGYFLQSVLEECRSLRLELTAYYTRHVTDEVTDALKPCFASWRSIAELKDPEAAALIRADGVQLLLDLSGHTANNRLPMFAMKPAPVQATWLGYFATTGVAQIDYVLGDPLVTPAGAESEFTERIWRLPESYLCFTPPAVSVAPGPLPALANGCVTFGCFNNLDKMNDEVVALWSRVLHAVPRSRLFLKTLQLKDDVVRHRTHQRFASHGIADHRVLLEGPAPRADLLAAYNRIDIALDPFPYPGGTTSVEGYWMGVPALSRRGDRFLSRIGETLAHNAGLSDWVADGDEAYVDKAATFAADLPSLSSLRATLRDRVLASPVCDAKRFARHLEAALLGMWETARPRTTPQ
jgi:predicted O-linked N-acetylglucosamine transferase (SPINDLY family)